ncbi:MAG: hypothetical protein AAB676_20505 [Verrucomicrobiota bacterium]
MNAIETQDLASRPQPPNNETREVDGREFLELCESLKHQGRYVAICEVIGTSHYRLMIRPVPPRLPAGNGFAR